MRKWMYLIISIIFLCILAGYTSSNRNEAEQLEQKEEQPELPALAFTNGETFIKTIRGAFSWTVLNEKTNEKQTWMVDIEAPPALVNIGDAVPFSISQSTVLTFGQVPTRYTINIWDEETIVASYHSFNDIKERGPHIIEIIGQWDISHVAYVAAIDIKD